MHEQLARRQIDQFIGRHPAVGAADPQVLRRLLLQQASEKARLAGLHGLGPDAVVAEKGLQFDVHRRAVYAWLSVRLVCALSACDYGVRVSSRRTVLLVLN